MPESPTTPELPEYLANVSDFEEHVRSALLKEISSSTNLRSHAEAIHFSEVILDKLCSSNPASDEARRIIGFLGLRMFNSICSSFRLTTHGYFQPAWAIMRDVIEIYFLLNLFLLDKSKILTWQNLEEKERKDKFRPSKVRKLVSELSVHQHDLKNAKEMKDMFDKWYDTYCHMASHPNPHAKELVFSDGALHFGPIEDKTLLAQTMFEIAKWAQAGALCIIAHLSVENSLQQIDGFFSQYKEWMQRFSSDANE